MIQKTCLVIDDNDQKDILDQLVDKARRRGITLQYYQFNIGSTERNDLLDENGAINLPLVIDRFKFEFDKLAFDLICVDFQLEDENVSGLDVLKAIYDLRSTSQYMVYSSNLDLVVKSIIENYDDDKDKAKLITRIKSLTRYKITEFTARDRYDAVILDILTKNELNIGLAFEKKLLEYPELIFQSTYPKFEGVLLKDIAYEIRKSSYHGQSFTIELIEQAVAHMVKVNE